MVWLFTSSRQNAKEKEPDLHAWLHTHNAHTKIHTQTHSETQSYTYHGPNVYIADLESSAFFTLNRKDSVPSSIFSSFSCLTPL